MEFESRTDVSLDEYMHMIRLKTSVLLATALQIGAYIAGATEAQQQALYDYGIHVGLAFQIQDDVLDVYGDPATFGKTIGGDILCNKKTCMLLTAHENATGADLAELEQLLAAAPSEEKIQAMTALYTRLHTREQCEALIAQHTAAAITLLDTLPAHAAADRLRTLALSLTHRQS